MLQHGSILETLLSEISQRQKDKSFHVYYEAPRISKCRHIKWNRGYQELGLGLRRKGERYCLKGAEFQLGMMKEVLEMDSDEVAQHCECA